MENWWQNKYISDNNFSSLFKSWEKGRNKLPIYKLIVEKYKCSNILNVGCGCGYDYMEYYEYFKKNNVSWYGIEYSDFMVNECKKNNIPAEKGNILNLNIKKTYDCVLCIDVLEHIDDLKTAFKNLFKVSKKYIVIAFF